MAENSFKHNAIQGFKWTLLERLSLQVIQFGIGIVVARYVLPAEYGIIGMLAIFMALGQAIQDSGFGIALIRKKEKTDADYSTAFFFNIIVGSIVYFIFYITAPLIADFYNTPELILITRVYMLTLLMNSLTIVQLAKMTSEYNFKLQFIINTVSILISGICGIIMAIEGLGVWTLVWQAIILNLLKTILIWLTAHWFPYIIFSKESFKYLFGFGSNMLLISFVDIIYNNIYTVFIGKFYTKDDLGYYTRANNYVSIPQNITSQIVSKVVLPVLAPYQDDNEKLLLVYEKIYKSIIFVVYPLLMLLLILSRPIILITIGKQWEDCVPYMQILSVCAMLMPLTYINVNLIMIKGLSGILLKIDIYKKLIGFVVAALIMKLGMIWICWGAAIYALAAFIINSYQTNKIIGLGLFKQIRLILPIIGRTVLMGIIVFCIINLIESSWIQIMVGGLAGSLVYLLSALLFKDESFMVIVGMIKKRLEK